MLISKIYVSTNEACYICQSKWKSNHCGTLGIDFVTSVNSFWSIAQKNVFMRKIHVLLISAILMLSFPTIAQPPTDVPSDIPTDIPSDLPDRSPNDQQIDEIFDNPIGDGDPDTESLPTLAETEDEERRRRIGLGEGVGVQFDSIGIFGHDYLRTNNFAYYETVEDINVSDDYILGPGDELTVNLWAGYDIQSDYFIISTDGYVQQEKWGRVYLQGLRYGEARRLLKTRYSKFYNFDVQDFELKLTGSRIINVDIVGDVEIPGSFRVPAVNTVYNVLKLSGGPTINGSVRKIQIKREGDLIQTLDVYDYLNNASNRQNIYLQDNDVIYVPQIGKVVEIEGAIKKETKYELLPNENLNSLLFFSGGFKPNALKNRIQLFRYDDDQYVLRDFAYNPENPSGTNPPLQDGDVIFVKEIPAEANNIVTIEGAINQPGYYEYESGLRITDLIFKANGIRFDAVTDKAYLTRFDEQLQATNISIDLQYIIDNPESESNIVLFPKDNLNVLSKSDFANEYPVHIYGSIKKPGKYKFGNEMTLQDLLILSGGFETAALNQQVELHRVIGYDESEGRRVPIRDIYSTFDVDYKFLTSKEGNSQIGLMPFDQVFVRKVPDFEIPKTVQIRGEVQYPGHYPLENKGMRISDLIERSGGTTAFAYRTGAKFFRDETYRVRNYGDTLKVSYKDTVIRSIIVVDLNEVKKNEKSPYNYVLKPNDMLRIPPVDEVVTIRGAIRNRINDTTIINTAFVGDQNAKWYIDNYGAGFSNDAWKRTTQVVYPNGQAVATRKFLWFNLYPDVTPGADVVVDFKPPREDKKRFFDGLDPQEMLSIIGSMTTTTALILAVGRRRP